MAKADPTSPPNGAEPALSVSADVRQLADTLAAISRDNREQMTAFADAMKVREDFSMRVAQRTSQIIRFSMLIMSVMGVVMAALILVLMNSMMDITKRMDDMSVYMNSMHKDFKTVATDMRSMDQQFHLMNRQMNVMTHDVNAMSGPMRMMPFRP